ncbi:Mob1/phocein [Calocera cornea HHB12733]|uniref:Mob1/phocein n=1 Tax=Calocera cornea HHB12733 TaxID=1353952 RepID=A0A165F292_9BASI|nr:Mob1/phocein [Calocera cornea HHB12733]
MAEVLTRLYPGTSLAYAFPAPNTPPSLASIDSAFELQEYLALLLRYDPHAVEELTKLPTGGDGEEVEKWAWIYEQIRRLVEDMNHPLITRLQEDCTRSSCPEMRANEWTYLCSAHGLPTLQQCCAIDYTLHTIDHITATLNSSKNFPSRLSIPQTSQRHISAIARRLARVFAHAYFHHREVFEESEVRLSPLQDRR